MADAKGTLRAELRDRRKNLAPEWQAVASRAAARRLLRSMSFSDGQPIALFWPMGSEIDTAPLRVALASLGAKILLPRMVGMNSPLAFHAWSDGMALERSRMGVMEPPMDAPVLTPEIIIVPLLGFDDKGFRLGYGGGFYDRTIASLSQGALRPRTIGYAFAAQLVDGLPHELHDISMDSIVTEERVWLFT